MPEISETQRTESLDVERFVAIARRRQLQFLIPFFLGWLIVWGASWIVAPRYKSGTLILVEQPSMPQNYVLPNVNDDLQSRLQSITQQILSRTRLLMIINKLHLYSGTQDKATADEKVDAMRKDIDVELVRDPQRQDISAFRISYSARDPHTAQMVTGELTNLFISENLKVRQEESQGTTTFLEKQLQDASANLAAQEAKVDQFEAQHEGALPTQEASNLQILSGLQSQLQNEQDALNTAKQQRVYLQALMQQERAAQAEARPSAGPGAVAAPTNLATVDQQLDTLRGQLTELSSRYTDRYPDVLRLKDEIAKTEALRDRMVAAARKKANDPKQQGDADADPTLDPAVRQLEGQLQANQLEITNRENAIAALKSRINDYQGRLNAEPGTEQQLADLTRGYDQSKANYDDLLKKRDQSEMATSMEQTQQGERFSMIDPPSLPTKPDFPNRLKFCALGFGVGLALGLVVAGGFEVMDDRIYSGKEIKAMLPMTVISEVPEVVTTGDKRVAKKKRILTWAVTAIVAVAVVSGSVFSYFKT